MTQESKLGLLTKKWDVLLIRNQNIKLKQIRAKKNTTNQEDYKSYNSGNKKIIYEKIIFFDNSFSFLNAIPKLKIIMFSKFICLFNWKSY